VLTPDATTSDAVLVGDLRFHVLGCDGTYAGPGGACSGYLVTTDDVRIWIDAGPGTLSRVQHHVALADLSAVVISHEHPDHSGELPVLRNALRFLLGVEGMPVLTTPGTRRLVEALTGGAEPTFAWDMIGGGAERQIGSLRLRFTTTDHPVDTVAIRIDHPTGSVAYSADTGAGLDGRLLDPDGTGLDLLVVEASMGVHEEDVVQHLSARQAAQLAIDSGARSVLVTHVVPGADPEVRRQEVEDALVAAGSSIPVWSAATRQTRS